MTPLKSTCTCSSFFTVRGVHKEDCPAYTQSTELEKIVEEFKGSYLEYENRPDTIDWLTQALQSYAQTKVDEALRGYHRDLLDVLEPYREYKEIEEVYQVIKGTSTTK